MVTDRFYMDPHESVEFPSESCWGTWEQGSDYVMKLWSQVSTQHWLLRSKIFGCVTDLPRQISACWKERGEAADAPKETWHPFQGTCTPGIHSLSWSPMHCFKEAVDPNPPEDPLMTSWVDIYLCLYLQLYLSIYLCTQILIFKIAKSAIQT